MLKTAVVTATLSHPTSRNVVIAYKTQGVTASGTGPGRDFIPASGTLTIRAGATSGRIRVTIVGDNRPEADEVFNVVATRVRNASTASGNSGNAFARVLIRDDDTRANARPTLSVEGPTVSEGDAATFTVSLSAASSRDVSVRYATRPGTATASRFGAVDGILTIPAGRTTASITVPTIDDGIVEGPQQFSLVLSTAANAVLGSNTATATLLNIDTPPEISVSSASRDEGDLGLRTLDFIVTLSTDHAAPVTVHYATIDGTAVAGSDYTPVSGTLTFAPGVTSLVVPVTILNDTLYEAAETFKLVLSDPSNATLSHSTAVGTIFDNDDPPPAAISGVTANEGDLGTLTPFTFTVTLSTPSGVAGSVDYATSDGTAIAGRDYQAASGTLVFEPGVTSLTITIDVIGNNLDEPDKVFTVNLSHPVNLKLATANSAANGTIVNDDLAQASETA
jgi:chitinase